METRDLMNKKSLEIRFFLQKEKGMGMKSMMRR